MVIHVEECYLLKESGIEELWPIEKKNSSIRRKVPESIGLNAEKCRVRKLKWF